jgi:hypothetical protein
MLLRQPCGNRVQFGFRLPECHPRLKTSHDLVRVIVPFRKQFAFFDFWDEYLRFVRHPKLGREHSHNGVSLVTELNGTAYDIQVGPKPVLPKIVADDRHRRRTGFRVVWDKGPSHQRLNLQH